MLTFADRSAIITGGASGIGRAIGEELAREGAHVVLADRNGPQAEAAAASIERAGGRATAARLDVTDADAVEALVRETAAEHGSLDYIFNNAGIAITGEAKDHSLDDWNKTLDVNLRGVVHGVHAAYEVMREQGHGHIVNVASLAGLIPAVNEIAYAAAKHGVVGLSTTLRVEAARYGVKVSVVCPGFVDTPILFENLTIKDPSRMPASSREDMKKMIRLRAMPVDKAAREIVAGVRRNKAMIVITLHAKLLWTINRISTRAMLAFARFYASQVEGM